MRTSNTSTDTFQEPSELYSPISKDSGSMRTFRHLFNTLRSDQCTILEKAFEAAHMRMPGPEQLRILSSEMNLSQRKLRLWFRKKINDTKNLIDSSGHGLKSKSLKEIGIPTKDAVRSPNITEPYPQIIPSDILNSGLITSPDSGIPTTDPMPTGLFYPPMTIVDPKIALKRAKKFRSSIRKVQKVLYDAKGIVNEWKHQDISQRGNEFDIPPSTSQSTERFMANSLIVRKGSTSSPNIAEYDQFHSIPTICSPLSDIHGDHVRGKPRPDENTWLSSLLYSP
jgi:hypothetical protein